jgi:hypothetical protein
MTFVIQFNSRFTANLRQFAIPQMCLPSDKAIRYNELLKSKSNRATDLEIPPELASTIAQLHLSLSLLRNGIKGERCNP